MSIKATKYGLGGLATAQKGILTEAGINMADNKFQLDQKDADLNGDGKLTKYEEARGEAVQKATSKDELVEMGMGGMMCADEDIDPVSGNTIPLGSDPENVRDDLPAMLSEGEYVLPADVVKWHGLKHILEMQDEAKMGLMSMFSMGLIQQVHWEEDEDMETDDEEGMSDDLVPEEDMDVEIAAVEVDDMTDEDEAVEEVYPSTSVLPAMMKRSKMAFIS
jgi:hypothetical protein